MVRIQRAPKTTKPAASKNIAPRTKPAAGFLAKNPRLPAHADLEEDERGPIDRCVEDRRYNFELLGPVVWFAAELLTSGKIDQVKCCASETCGWLFLDNTENHSRRWCDMGDCGSQAKAKRYYRKKIIGLRAS